MVLLQGRGICRISASLDEEASAKAAAATVDAGGLTMYDILLPER